MPPELQKIIQDYIRPIKKRCHFCNKQVITCKECKNCKECKFCNICGTNINNVCHICHVCIFFGIYFTIFIILTYLLLYN